MFYWERAVGRAFGNLITTFVLFTGLIYIIFSTTMYIMTKLQATVKSHFWFARPSPEMWNSKWIAWVCRCMVCLELHQRWANSVLMNEYEYYSTFKKWPNTDTNIIWFEKSTKYEYRYYSVWKNYPNTNTSIRSQLFKWYLNTELFAYLCHSWGSSWHHSWGPWYEYYSVWKKMTE